MIATVPNQQTAVSRNQNTDCAPVFIDTATQTIDNSSLKTYEHSAIDQVRLRRQNRQLNTAIGLPLQITDSAEKCNQTPARKINMKKPAAPNEIRGTGAYKHWIRRKKRKKHSLCPTVVPANASDVSASFSNFREIIYKKLKIVAALPASTFPTKHYY